MNKYEIYVLNRALDGEDIFSLPSFSKLNIPDIMAEDIKSTLIEKGVLESQDRFSEKGARMANRLHLFKGAQKQVKIGYLSLGILNDRESISILYNPMFEEYEMTMINSVDLAAQLTSVYLFLSSDESDGEVTEEETQMPRREFRKAFILDQEKQLRIIVQTKEGKNDDTYFLHDGSYYIYDRIKGILWKKNYHSMIAMMAERMQVQ